MVSLPAGVPYQAVMTDPRPTGLSIVHVHCTPGHVFVYSWDTLRLSPCCAGKEDRTSPFINYRGRGTHA